MHTALTSRRVFLFLAPALALSAQPKPVRWKFYPQQQKSASGILFTFEHCPNKTALVTIAGTADGKPFSVHRYLSFKEDVAEAFAAFETGDLKKLKIEWMLVIMDGKQELYQFPKEGQYYPFGK